MKKVYFVRHGESEGNAGPVRQSDSTPLSQEGLRQADLVAERCSKLDFEVLVSSPIVRAHQTAEIISKKVGKPIEFNELFRERRPASVIPGQPKESEFVKNYEKTLREKFHLPGWRHSDEENFDDLKERARKALDYLASRPEGALLVVTHGLFLRVMAAYVTHGPGLTGQECTGFMRTFRTANTGIFAFSYEMESGWRLWIWNDHAHLG